MKRHIERARAQLGDLHGLAAKTEASERAILKAAEKRLGVVQQQLERLSVGADTAPEEHQQRYLDLTAERGQLHTVIAKAQAALA